MHNIGNITEAGEILSWVRRYSHEYGIPDCVRSESAPEGWAYVGHGSFRSVWRSPSGVAYKVNHTVEDCQNRDEVENLMEAWVRGVPEGCRLPRFDLFEVDEESVVAVELIRGKVLRDCRDRASWDVLVSLLRQVERKFDLCDLHTDNAIVDEDGLLVVVDFGG